VGFRLVTGGFLLIAVRRGIGRFLWVWECLQLELYRCTNHCGTRRATNPVACPTSAKIFSNCYLAHFV